MATQLQTPVERQAVARSLQAQTAVRAFARSIDKAVAKLDDLVVELAIERQKASSAVGSESTRPYYTDDLSKLHRQWSRMEILTAALVALDKRAASR
jgi:hypothetical protein